MTTASEAIPAMPASDVTLPDDEIALREPAHICSNRRNLPNKFVAYCHRHGNRLLGPGVPVINVNIRAAD